MDIVVGKYRKDSTARTKSVAENLTLPYGFTVIGEREIQPRAWVSISQSTSKVDTNKYTMTITVTCPWQSYGNRIYAYYNGKYNYVDTIYVGSGSGNVTKTYTHTFTLTKSGNVWAYTVCAACEDGRNTTDHPLNDDRGQFEVWSNETTLTYVNPVPSAPTWCTASGKYEVGEATGTITGYEVQYIQYDYGTGSWTSWGNVAEQPSGTNTSTEQTIYSVGLNRDRVRYRVKAKNSGGSSSWSPESNDIFHYGVKVNKSGFKWGEIRIYKNGSWHRGRVKVYKNGAWTNSK